MVSILDLIFLASYVYLFGDVKIPHFFLGYSGSFSSALNSPLPVLRFPPSPSASPPPAIPIFGCSPASCCRPSASNFPLPVPASRHSYFPFRSSLPHPLLAIASAPRAAPLSALPFWAFACLHQVHLLTGTIHIILRLEKGPFNFSWVNDYILHISTTGISGNGRTV